jgi:hypothetical protein
MKPIFLFVFFIGMMLYMRIGCSERSQADLTKDCQVVCEDIGYVHDYAVKTGLFTYRCQCKGLPKTVPIRRRP